MSDLSINWKKNYQRAYQSRSKRYANDRIPTLEEIRKIVEYPDRRIKPIVYTICSSGIGLGAWGYLKWKRALLPTNFLNRQLNPNVLMDTNKIDNLIIDYNKLQFH